MLRDAPLAPRLDQVGAQLGVSIPGFVREMYARHDGAAMAMGDRRGLYLFPMWWEWMPLDEVLAQSKFGLLWLREYELDAFPFALDGTGVFLACSAGQVETVWVIDADPPSPAWPDGSVGGLLRATCGAYRGSNAKFESMFLTKTGWRGLHHGNTVGETPRSAAPDRAATNAPSTEPLRQPRGELPWSDTR